MSVFTNPAGRSSEQAAAYTRALLELLGAADPMAVLRSTPGAVRRAVEGLTEDELSRPERAGKWSVRQVVRHLADSEVVYGWRLRLTLAEDRPSLGGYDQDAWADRLAYAEADVAVALEEIDVLRRSNLRLMERATPADLERVAVHVERGEESVAHMARLYAGHDLLHLRQIERIRAAVGSGRSGA